MNLNTVIRVVGRVPFFTSLFAVPIFGAIASVIKPREPFAWEVETLQRLHQINEPVMEAVLRPFYVLGDSDFAAIMVGINLLILAWHRLWKEAAVFAMATLGILILVDRIFKPLFARRRPPERLDKSAHGFSFPSGHASGNVVLYFYLSFLVATHFPKTRPYIYGASTLLMIGIGISSLYLRVHWPTDIIGGYLFGYIWLTICLGVLRFSEKTYRRAGT